LVRDRHQSAARSQSLDECPLAHDELVVALFLFFDEWTGSLESLLSALDLALRKLLLSVPESLAQAEFSSVPEQGSRRNPLSTES